MSVFGRFSAALQLNIAFETRDVDLGSWLGLDEKLLTVKTEGEFNVSVGSLGGSRGVGSNTEDGFRFKAGASRLIGYSTDITVKVDAKPLIEHVKTVTVRNVQKAAEITTQAARDVYNWVRE